MTNDGLAETLDEWAEIMVLKIYKKLNEDNQSCAVTLLIALLEKQGNYLHELIGTHDA